MAEVQTTTSKMAQAAVPLRLRRQLVNPVSEVEKASRIRTGLLPAFATFEAKGKEGGVDLGVHFGFAPQINNANGVHDNFGTNRFGAQIDMRQVYLTAGGTWGQILAGREIGLYQRNNILNDMTLFGVGARAARGFWRRRYDARPHRLRLRLSELRCADDVQQPDVESSADLDRSVRSERHWRRRSYTQTKIPRVESEFTWTGHFGATTAEAPAGTDKVMVFVSGEWQHASTPIRRDSASKDSYGGAGGVRADFSGLSLVGSGFVRQGHRHRAHVRFRQRSRTINGDLRTSYGFIGQAEFQPMGTKWKFGASYGESDLKQTSDG